MYLDYETYTGLVTKPVSEIEYEKVSVIADAVIDTWTLDRVGNAVKDGVELPGIIKALYCSIVNEIPNAMAYEGSGGKVSSFSNGVDSFSFDTSDTFGKRLKDSCSWILDYMPNEWGNTIASEWGKYPHAS